MALVQDIVTGALRLLGVVAGAEDAEPEDLAVGVFALNEMLNAWNALHWPVYTIEHVTHTLVAGTNAYTIGAGGTIDMPRPTKIESAGIVEAGLRTALTMIGSTVWASIPDKGARAKQPLNLYNDGDFPLSTLFLWPAPKAASTLDLWMWNEVEAPLAADDSLNLPPNYDRCVRFNLAVAVAPEFGREPSATVMGIAQQSKAEILGLTMSNAQAVEDVAQPQG